MEGDADGNTSAAVVGNQLAAPASVTDKQTPTYLDGSLLCPPRNSEISSSSVPLEDETVQHDTENSEVPRGSPGTEDAARQAANRNYSFWRKRFGGRNKGSPEEKLDTSKITTLRGGEVGDHALPQGSSHVSQQQVLTPSAYSARASQSKDAYESMGFAEMKDKSADTDEKQRSLCMGPSASMQAVASGSRRVVTHAKSSIATVKERVKNAPRVASWTGKHLGRAWNKALDSAMIVSVAFGIVGILLLALAMNTRLWRHQDYSYTDGNGNNWSRVNLGLTRVQRIQGLHLNGDAGEVFVYDVPMQYNDLIFSAYCVPEDQTAGENPITEYNEEFLDRRLRSAADADGNQRRGRLADPPPFLISLGRDPAAPGSVQTNLRDTRRLLLGPTVYDLNCKDLNRFKKGGELFVRLATAFFVFAVIGVVTGIIVVVLGSRKEAMYQWASEMPINLLGTTAWITALVLHLAALASWGGYTDVAACVTSEGGASVCSLGAASIVAIVSLATTLLATTAYCVFFTHKHIRGLGLKWENEHRLREETERRRSQEAPQELLQGHCLGDDACQYVKCSPTAQNQHKRTPDTPRSLTLYPEFEGNLSPFQEKPAMSGGGTAEEALAANSESVRCTSHGASRSHVAEAV